MSWSFSCCGTTVLSTCHGALAVVERLYYQHVSSSSACRICQNGPETIIHSIFECKYATEIWCSSAFNHLISDLPVDCFVECLIWVADRLDSRDLAIFLTLAWASWCCRNKAAPVADRVAQGLIHFVESWVEYDNKVYPPDPMRAPFSSDSGWKCSPEVWVKVNVDVHINEGGMVGVGTVVCGSNGAILLAVVRRYGSRWSVDMAEACAARFGVLIASRFGFLNVI